tara:strand:+ start:4083 stop:4355 length:273 start_codon:yes stop_codon:yes gene_type:complete
MIVTRNWQSPRMNEIEKQYDLPLGKVLINLQNEFGASGTVETLGISKATLGYWNLKCGIRVIRVAYQPNEGEEVRVYDRDGSVKHFKGRD